MEDSKGYALRMGYGGIPRQVKPAKKQWIKKRKNVRCSSFLLLAW